MIITQNQPGVAHLVISRTDKKNALTRDMYRALAEAVSKAAADTSVHAIVLSGEGGVFTAGNDLDDFRARATDENPKPSAGLAFIEALMVCDTPVIAAVEGLAIGIGTTLLLHCDSVIAGRSARFKTAFVDLGLVTEAASTVTMPLHLGSRRTADLLLVGDTLDGEEASFIVMVDGEHVLPMATSQDHKRVGDGDTGPNTGGMGAYSPAPVVTPDVHTRIMDEVIYPTVRGMAAEGHPYKGFLYAGLMIDGEGTPKVIEFNCRFGDPEAQVILPRLRTDIVTAMLATVEGGLADLSLHWADSRAVTVVMAAKGYPGDYEKGSVITGIEAAGTMENTIIFHAGTNIDDQGNVRAAGGRVLAVTGMGDDAASARDAAYRAVAQIDWPDGFCRSDIAAS